MTSWLLMWIFWGRPSCITKIQICKSALVRGRGRFAFANRWAKGISRNCRLNKLGGTKFLLRQYILFACATSSSRCTLLEGKAPLNLHWLPLWWERTLLKTLSGIWETSLWGIPWRLILIHLLWYRRLHWYWSLNEGSRRIEWLCLRLDNVCR